MISWSCTVICDNCGAICPTSYAQGKGVTLPKGWQEIQSAYPRTNEEPRQYCNSEACMGKASHAVVYGSARRRASEQE